jgi:hypothetical protein
MATRDGNPVHRCRRCMKLFALRPNQPRHIRHCKSCLLEFTRRECKGCGCTFHLRPFQNLKTRYCSTECRDNYRSRVCPTCGRTFILRANQPASARWCSPGCYAKSPDQKRNFLAWHAKLKAQRPVKICPGCDKPIVKPYANRQIYCSRLCYHRDRANELSRQMKHVNIHFSRWAPRLQPEPPPPTPAEIQQRAAAVRAGWSETERCNRIARPPAEDDG